MNSTNIQFSVSLEEANLIFKALGKLPFTDVYELIGKLNEQANAQLASPEDDDEMNTYGEILA